MQNLIQITAVVYLTFVMLAAPFGSSAVTPMVEEKIYPPFKAAMTKQLIRSPARYALLR